ncbi:MAG TPA: cobalamin-binding protein [Acidimicrobiales bacterium]|nr:cobalamin-binding protein [Acidimicrobiales bacterium]
MRILSLLPSATEIVYLLGLGDELVGVTHECDWPPDACEKPRVSYTTLPPDARPDEIDRLVSESANGGAPIHGVDHRAIRVLDPDLVITQDLCAVCALPAGHMRAALDMLGIDAEVISLDPSSLDDVLASVVTVGAATRTESRAAAIVGGLRRRLDAVRAAVDGETRPRTFALEWGDPPFNGGHWVPEMIELAGGEPLLASRRTPSVRLSWREIAEAEPEVVVFMPCGYGLDAATAEAAALVDRPELGGARAFYVVAANSFFSRPGPRLVDGVEALGASLHERSGLAARPDAIARLR